MDERRTAADALASEEQFESDKIKQFVARGLPGESAPPSKKPAPRKPAAATTKETTTEEVVQPKKKSQTAKRKEAPKPTQAELQLALAKATVQKTVRFDPRLIAEWETFSREQESRGEKPKAFQQVQNEALRLWLERFVRT